MDLARIEPECYNFFIIAAQAPSPGINCCLFEPLAINTEKIYDNRMVFMSPIVIFLTVLTTLSSAVSYSSS